MGTIDDIPEIRGLDARRHLIRIPDQVDVPLTPRIGQLIDTAERIDGLPFVRLKHVVRYKRLARRPKDLEHLRLLDAAIDGRQA